MSELTRTAGELLRARREAHELPRERLAIRAASTPERIAALEHEQQAPTPGELERLLLALGEELFTQPDGTPSARAIGHACDPGQIARYAALPIAERLARALDWNNFAANIMTAPRRPLPPRDT